LYSFSTRKRGRENREIDLQEDEEEKNTGIGEMKYRWKLGLYTASPLNTLEGKVH
jgi:hypothetical protein